MRSGKPSGNTAISPEEHDAHFFSTSTPTIPSNFAELLSSYSHIPLGEAQTTHVQSLREAAYKTHPYPCLGLYRFTILALSEKPIYRTHILPLLTSPPAPNTPDPIILDLGTCLGQDVRKLIHDGVPVSRVYGSDILPEFIDLGYSLFRDGPTLPRDHFLTPADIFDSSPSNVLSRLDGKCSIIHCNAIFHLFNYPDQLFLAQRIITLLRPQECVLVLGSNNAHRDAGEKASRPGHRSATRWLHSAESWRTLWEEVGEDMEPKVRFRVESEVFPHTVPRGVVRPEDGNSRDEGGGWMKWEVWRE